MKNMHEKIDLEHERKSLNSQIQAMMKEKVTTLCIVDIQKIEIQTWKRYLMKSSAQTFFVSMEIISKHQRNGDLAKFLHNI